MTASSPRQAVNNGHDVGSYETGMCQKFVRDQCWRVPSLYGSAIDAWNGARYKHPGDRNPPEGAPCYYRGGNYGHAVIFCGPDHGDDIRSTDCTSAYDVSDVPISWVESHWGYVYLGWTEDINGVRVINGSEDDEMETVNVNTGQKIARWSPWSDDVEGDEIALGKCWSITEGYAEKAYTLGQSLNEKVNAMQADIDAIKRALGI